MRCSRPPSTRLCLDGHGLAMEVEMVNHGTDSRARRTAKRDGLIVYCDSLIEAEFAHIPATVPRVQAPGSSDEGLP
jgi:hypothetical protein